MKRGLIVLSCILALGATLFASTSIDKRISKLEKELKKLKKQVKRNKKKIKRVNKKASIAKAQSFQDNIKWNVDLRTAADMLSYTTANGKKIKNDSLFTNRLWLNMKYKGDEKVTFYGTLSYLKAYGDSANHSQANTNPRYADFDWVTNENANDGSVKVKEAYWLYSNNTFNGAPVSWTASIGRRPSTDGLGINFREGNKRKSAIASTVNIEFDGISLRWNVDKIGFPTGSWFKICAGRGITNAYPRFKTDQNGTTRDYTKNNTLHSDSDMVGIIVVPYDDGQYSIHMNYAQAKHMIGFESNGTAYKEVNGSYGNTPAFQDLGDFNIMTIMFKAEGIGNEINDYLDNTIFFASYSRSVTDPKKGKKMLGSPDRKSGHSVWVGIQAPCPLTEDGRLGIEYNKGSNYWRSMTYAEDTMIGSKIAARGKAFEVYWLKPLTKSLSLSLRYTKIKYDYTGSNGFFGDEGTPMSMTEAKKAGYDPVEKAIDTRIAIRYQF